MRLTLVVAGYARHRIRRDVNTKQRLLALFVLVVSLVLSGCGTGGLTLIPTATVESTSTPLPTSTQVPTPTSLPTEVVVMVNQAAMEIISTWDSGIVAFTPADNPVTTLTGLTPAEVGFWNNSRLGFDLYNEVVKILMADQGAWDGGLFGCPNVDEAFTSCPCRIYFTDDSITKIDGAASVIFQANP
jgi:hypothetical protein